MYEACSSLSVDVFDQENGVCGSVDGTSIYDANGDGSELTAVTANLCGA